MSELLLIGAAIGVVALVVWLRRRRGTVDPGNDRLTRACSGDQVQAQRLEDLEHSQSPEPLSRQEARARALERLIDDRST
ncbi:hypothetical protein [Aquisalimonas sp.]|uniref:hypothetical protein n=1 Tax=Aquisalimonas sp. TaxID=1872621 RepID=UPI0025C203B6|nr:hypothetical protein [Aquisalimonas sp.]